MLYIYDPQSGLTQSKTVIYAEPVWESQNVQVLHWGNFLPVLNFVFSKNVEI